MVKTPDYSELLTTQFEGNPVWKAFADAVTVVFGENIVPSRQLLLNQRDPSAMERVVKIATLKMLGLNIESDIFSDIDLDRTLATYPQFCGERGLDDRFVDYIGFLKDVRLNMKALFTRDYVHFYDAPKGTMIENGGDWYATTHVSLEYDGFMYYHMDESQIIRMWDNLAPINLVLLYLAEVFNFGEIVLYIAGIVYESIEKINLLNYPYSDGNIFIFPSMYEKEYQFSLNDPTMNTNLYVIATMHDKQHEIFNYVLDYPVTLYAVCIMHDWEYWFGRNIPVAHLHLGHPHR